MQQRADRGVAAHRVAHQRGLLDAEGVVIGTLGGSQSPQQVQTVISGLTVAELEDKAEKLGGIVLIGIGLKILIEHTLY